MCGRKRMGGCVSASDALHRCTRLPLRRTACNCPAQARSCARVPTRIQGTQVCTLTLCVGGRPGLACLCMCMCAESRIGPTFRDELQLDELHDPFM